jgi:hypothetical protein
MGDLGQDRMVVIERSASPPRRLGGDDLWASVEPLMGRRPQVSGQGPGPTPRPLLPPHTREWSAAARRRSRRVPTPSASPTQPSGPQLPGLCRGRSSCRGARHLGLRPRRLHSSRCQHLKRALARGPPRRREGADASHRSAARQTSPPRRWTSSARASRWRRRINAIAKPS